MNLQHKELAAGRWAALPFVEQMANIGSEVERAINWKAKQNSDYSRKAFDRSLELLDLTLDSVKGFARLKEVARLREAVADYFAGTNEAGLTDESLKKYFFHFTFAARKGR
ncbi:MAG: hypothetical protein HQL18_05115 [Candidatus Omnitrophica bacterium]|nr:hypothetical protein [Candidatus Omnitrophota bacterium]